MHKLIFGIFAHPDDEAFGPSATLMKEVEQGAELQLLCVTAGQLGMGSGAHAEVGKARLQEWRAAGAYMGASQIYDLGYMDGHLSNHIYHALADDIETAIRMACKDKSHTSLCLMTFDTTGLTGHLDHITVSYVTTYVFWRLKARPPEGVEYIELAYYCLSEAQVPTDAAKYFVFYPDGRTEPYINRTVDVRDMLPRKYTVMKLHATQAEDAARLMAYGDDHHAYDYFHVIP